MAAKRRLLRSKLDAAGLGGLGRGYTASQPCTAASDGFSVVVGGKAQTLLLEASMAASTSVRDRLQAAASALSARNADKAPVLLTFASRCESCANPANDLG